jgi:DNA polymerase (family X)
MRNAEIAEAFEELAGLYELDGAVVYRVTAYRNAAKAIREAGVSVAEMARQGRVDELAGVGRTIAEKIDALLETGSIPSADKLKARIPAGLIAITRIPGLGPKRAKLLHDELGITSLDELRVAAEQGRLKDVPGFGAKAEENVMAALAAGADGRPKERMLLSKALAVGDELVAGLREHPAALEVELAGSARRRADTVKDLDIVVAASDPEALAEHFCSLPAVDVVQTSGEAGAKVVTHTGLPVDLRIVPEEAFGNLLQHFTGSGRHNEALRTAAVRRGLHVSEYGIADDQSGDTVDRVGGDHRGGHDEEDGDCPDNGDDPCDELGEMLGNQVFHNPCVINHAADRFPACFCIKITDRQADQFEPHPLTEAGNDALADIGEGVGG